MRSTNKEVAAKVQGHILESMEDFDDRNYADAKEAALELYTEFKTTFGGPYEVKRAPREEDRFQKYIGGGAFNFLIWVDDKREWIVALGIAQKREYSDQEVESYYAYLIYRETLKLI